MKISLRLTTTSCEVEATSVRFKGFEMFQFGIHETLWSEQLLDNVPPFSVTEIETGLVVGRGDNPEEAHWATAQGLSHITPEILRKTIDAVLNGNKHPRWVGDRTQKILIPK